MLYRAVSVDDHANLSATHHVFDREFPPIHAPKREIHRGITDAQALQRQMMDVMWKHGARQVQASVE